ncbi:MAG: helix-turn-helix domain-containing protein [Salinivirgaceae bacterium]|jgi:AraC-like DNA-binding protein
MILSFFQYITIAGLINAFAVSLFLAFRKNHHSANIYLSLLLIIVSFQAVLNAFDNRDFFLLFPHLGKISWLTPSLFGPLVYLFTIKISSGYEKFKPADLVHFIPFSIYMAVLFPWFTKSAEEKRTYFNNFELASVDDFGFINQLSIFIILFYFLITLLYLRKHRERIKNSYSETSKVRLDWLRHFIYLVLVILIFTGLAFYGRKVNLAFLSEFYHYTYALVVILIYWIAFKVATQPIIFGTENHFVNLNMKNHQTLTEKIELTEWPETKKYKKSGLDSDKLVSQYQYLLDFMDTKKPFLEPELTIFQLSEMVNISKHHLSQIINEKVGKNFFDFINEYRVNELKQKLSDPSLQNLTLMALATDSGFNSKATFNAAFKKITGLTPSMYKKVNP